MPEGPIVCNAGPLIALAIVEHLDLLEKLYRRILLPEAVLYEITQAGAGRIGAAEVAATPWLERIRAERPLEPLLEKELGVGEAEVITVAYQTNAKLVLIDDRRARRIAEQAYGLQVKGSAGILVAAKRAGLVSAIRPLLEKMNSQGYYLSPRLIARASEEAGE
jgi:uncharacterized protein